MLPLYEYTVIYYPKLIANYAEIVYYSIVIKASQYSPTSQILLNYSEI